MSTAQLAAEETPAAWLRVVRDTPYVFSAGLYDNLTMIRRWVLLGEGFCDRPDRHVLFDQRGRFLTWLNDSPTLAETQQRLNSVRELLYQKGRVHRWIGGTLTETGYPFALSCKQPHVDLADSLDRLFGRDPDDLVWGQWDGMRVGRKEAPVPLIELVLQVFRQRAGQVGLEVSDEFVRTLLGQLIVESGVRKHSVSAARAVGLLQLRPEVLSDCRLPRRFHLHRMAQVDCAVRLYVQIDRNLRPLFEARFGALPAAKRQRLYALLLTQTYHAGIGRMRELLGDGEPGRAARSLAEDHGRYTAEDLALGIVFHNLGRVDLGLASLFYLVDVAIAGDQVCDAVRRRQLSYPATVALRESVCAVPETRPEELTPARPPENS
ncbi:MAG: hypothetical protein Kow006_04070 [Gammaproteobacteria bacterium]